MQLPPPPSACSPRTVCLHTRTWQREKRVAQTCRVSLTSTRHKQPNLLLHLPRPSLAVVLWLFTHLHIICVGWHSKGRGEGLLIAATLAASHSSCLATCNSRSSSSSSGSNGGPSRFRCLGTTRLLEEVASCQGRGGRGGAKALNDFVSFFAFPCALLSPFAWPCLSFHCGLPPLPLPIMKFGAGLIACHVVAPSDIRQRAGQVIFGQNQN